MIDGMFAERFDREHWADLPLPVFRSRLRYLCMMPGIPVVQVHPPQETAQASKKIIYIDRSGSDSAGADLTLQTG